LIHSNLAKAEGFPRKSYISILLKNAESIFSLKFVEAKIFKFGVYLAPSRIAKKTPRRPESFPFPESEVLSGTIESISSTKRKQVSHGINYALSAISFNILSESPTIPLLKSPAAFKK
jgi:hypothetical protein